MIDKLREIVGRNRALAIIVFLGIMIRLAIFAVTKAVIWPDSLSYLEEARGILTYHNFDHHEIFHAPLYPLLLSFFMKLDRTVAGNDLVIIFQQLLGLGSGILTYHLAKRIFNVRVGLIAASLMCLHPLLLYYEVVIQTEVLFEFVFLAALLLVVKLFERPTVRSAVYAGLSLALAILTRPVAQFVTVLVAAATGIKEWKCKKRIKVTAIFCIMTCVCLLPWMEVNRESYGFFGVTKGQGINLFLTTFEVYNLPEPTHGDEKIHELFATLREEKVRNNELSPIQSYFFVFNRIAKPGHLAHVQADQQMYLYAQQAIEEHPFLFIEGVLKTFPHFFVGTKNSIHFCDAVSGPVMCSNHILPHNPLEMREGIKLQSKIVKSLIEDFFGVERVKEYLIAILALGGIIIAFVSIKGEGRVLLTMIVAIVLYFAAATIIFNVPNDRYRLPVDPILFMFAAVLLDRTVSKWHTLRNVTS